MYTLHKLPDQGLATRVFEAADGVGGTWYWNRYPGARCESERPPSTVGPRPPLITSRNELLQDAQFWSVAAPFALALSAQVGTIVFQVSYLLPLLGTSGTSIALVCTSVTGVVGRFGLVW